MSRKARKLHKDTHTKQLEGACPSASDGPAGYEMGQDRNRYLRERVSVEWVLDQPNRAAPGRRACLSTEKKDCPSLTREVALLTWPHKT